MYSSAPIKQVKRFVIEVLDPHNITEYSVRHITRSSVSFDERIDTVFDPRLGAIGYGEKCGTCNCDVTTCPGHFGHIVLNMPFYQPFFLNHIYKIIQQCCWSCFHPLQDNQCKHCGKKQGKWHKEGIFKDKITHRCGNVKKEYSTLDVQHILRKYDEKFRPKQPVSWLITTVLPVIPPCSRPSIMNNGCWCHNSLSHCYSNIVKENNVLGVFIQQNQPQHIIHQQWRRCQDQIYKIYDVRNMNETSYMEGLRQRLDGKRGRARKNLVGKRVDYSARTVVGGDPKLQIDQIGIPKSIAMRLTIPETVTLFNRERMMKIVNTGPDELGGALYVEKKYDGSRFDLKFAGSLSTIASQLKVGDIVERMLMDGDLVAVNRQPSLHKYSIMSMRVKVLLAGSVFKINLSVTSPFNA